jgi:tripartite-type tricarboxylate transporter receptor subunit TctC
MNTLKNSPIALKRLRVLTSTLAFITVCFGFNQTASAQVSPPAFPNKPIKIIVPFGPGGIADLTARAISQKLAENLGQPVVIENKPGAGGVVAGNTLLGADPDGHTLLLISNGTAVSSGLFKALPFDANRDFAAISTLAFFDMALVTGSQSKFSNLGDLLNYSKANPGKLNIGSINIGSTQNLAAELFKSTAGIDGQVIPYNGTPAVVTALRSGDIDVAVEILGPVMGQLNSKALRGLAVMSEKRSSALAEIPTAAEAGVKNLLVSSWNGLATHSKAPKDAIARINKEVNAVLNLPDIKKRLADLNVDARPSTAAQAQDLLASETKRWGDVIVRAKIEKQ